MEEEIIKGDPEIEKCGLLSRLYSTWVFSLVMKGLKRDIELSDVTKCSPSMKSKHLADQLEIIWKQELKRNKPSFLRANARMFAKDLLVVTLLTIIRETFFTITQPIFLTNLIQYFANTNDLDFWDACLNALALLLSSFLFMLSQHPQSYFSIRLAIKTRTAWVTLIYRKSISLNNKSLANTTVGQIVNLMSNDLSKLDEFTMIGAHTLSTPIQAIILVMVSFNYFHIVSLVGLSLIFILTPINFLIGLMSQRIQKKIAERTDIRVDMMNEIIKAMRVIKMYAWEKHFARMISTARKNEILQLRNSIVLDVFSNALGFISGRLILFFILVLYVLQGNVLTSYKVFVIVAMLDNVGHDLMFFFPYAISMFFHMLVICNRIQEFLLLDEVTDTNCNSKYFHSDIPSKIPIHIHDAVVKWDSNKRESSVSKLSLEIKQGDLVVVIGTVGSGKSTFLMSLLNEVPIESGTIVVNGKMTYASQEPWSFNASILQNILLGKKYEKEKFENIIDVCEMRQDLERYPYREHTLVGERGMILSGGQKARLTLARTLYNDADVYLLDDPLSAVDAQVANNIFEKCFDKYLKEKTIILVTHQIQFLKKASKILVLNNGEQVAFGTYNKLIKENVDLKLLLEKPFQTNLASIDLNEIPTLTTDDTEIVLKNIDNNYIPKVEEEKRKSGSINWNVYWAYIRAGAGPFLMILIVASTIVYHFEHNYITVWLSEWSNKQDKDIKEDVYHKIYVYSTMMVVLFITSFLRSFTFYLMFLFASINLHNMIFNSFIRLPISFFDNNPAGRILNRFSKDIGIIDTCLPDAATDISTVYSEIISVLVVASVTKWTLIFPALFVIIVMMTLRTIYLKTSRDLRRFEGYARSSLINHTTVSVNGMTTIRSFEVQKLFEEQFYRYQNDHTAIYMTGGAANLLLSIFMDIACILYMISFITIMMASKDELHGGKAGLAFSTIINMIGMLQWGVRQSAELKNHMTSVESILEYSNLKPEAPLESNYVLPPNWPSVGSIIFDHVSLCYDNPPTMVLNDLCFVVKGGEKVGIVGRTGSGKSSLITALFRLVKFEGSILIDGVDCSALGLHELRKKMSIIPQDPIAFMGTIRINVDPFGEYTDDDIWDVLEEVELKRFVSELPGQLSYEITESGRNLSSGQRQLFCLARALLRKNQILILDEATANVDQETDEHIQKTIRHNFAKCTVLTIAHRLNTIIDSDRVIVMSDGKIVQNDTPENLLKNTTGIFYKLYQQSNARMSLFQDISA